MPDPGRIYFVITLQGDRGPFDRSELQEQLRDGRLRSEDRVRNAFGRSMGTVAELLARRASEPIPVATPAAFRPRGRGPLIALLAVGAGLAAVAAAWLLLGHEPAETVAAARPATPAAAPPLPAPAVATTPPAPPSGAGLPADWSLHDIGCSATHVPVVDAQGWHLLGVGSDIWGTADHCRLIAKPLAGDGSITVRVATFSCRDAMSKVGLMFRREALADSPFVALCLTGQGMAVRYCRSDASGKAGQVVTARGTTAPRWLRLTRKGAVFSAYLSNDGQAWTALGEGMTLAKLPGRLLAGVVVASKDGPQLQLTIDPPLLAPDRH